MSWKIFVNFCDFLCDLHSLRSDSCNARKCLGIWIFPPLIFRFFRYSDGNFARFIKKI